MTRDRWLENPEAVAEAERTYAFVGKYVMTFQWLEGKIDEVFFTSKRAEKTS